MLLDKIRDTNPLKTGTLSVILQTSAQIEVCAAIVPSGYDHSIYISTDSSTDKSTRMVWIQ